MENMDIRRAAIQEGVRLWEVAEAYGVCDTSFSRKLRRELPEVEKKKIFDIISQISAKKRKEDK